MIWVQELWRVICSELCTAEVFVITVVIAMMRRVENSSRTGLFASEEYPRVEVGKRFNVFRSVVAYIQVEVDLNICAHPGEIFLVMASTDNLTFVASRVPANAK